MSTRSGQITTEIWPVGPRMLWIDSSVPSGSASLERKTPLDRACALCPDVISISVLETQHFSFSDLFELSNFREKGYKRDVQRTCECHFLNE